MRNSNRRNNNQRSVSRRTTAPVTRTMNSGLTIRSPRGREYTVENISAFARKHKLDRSHLWKVLNGARMSHKNWTLAA